MSRAAKSGDADVGFVLRRTRPSDILGFVAGINPAASLEQLISSPADKLEYLGRLDILTPLRSVKTIYCRDKETAERGSKCQSLIR